MRQLARLLALALALPLLGAGAGLAGTDQLPRAFHQPISVERPDQALFNAAVLYYSNAVRAAHGRAPLRPDAGLSRAAAEHAINMARLRIHSHELPVRGQAKLAQRMHRQSLKFRQGAENIAKDKLFRLLGRPISMSSRGCQFTYADTRQAVPIHTYASLAEQVVARWLASPGHRASLLSRSYRRLGAGVGVDPHGPACGDLYLVQDFAD